MAINLQSTANISTDGIKVLVYGSAGAGKTSLIRTLPAPLILSAEGGLLSLAGENLPFVEIHSIEEIQEIFNWLISSEEAKQFESIALDSISEIAEVVLSGEKAKAKDARQAYGETQDKMNKIIRAFRDLPHKNVYFSAKVERAQDEQSRLLYTPMMPGQKLGMGLPYFFDEVFPLITQQDEQGNVQRALLTQSNGLWTAKDRSGRLNMYEPADLGAVIRKIGGLE